MPRSRSGSRQSAPVASKRTSQQQAGLATVATRQTRSGAVVALASPPRRKPPSAASIAKSLATRAANLEAKAAKVKAGKEAAAAAKAVLLESPLPLHWKSRAASNSAVTKLITLDPTNRLQSSVYHGTKTNHPRLIYESDLGFDPRRSNNHAWEDANLVSWFARDAKYSCQETVYAHAIGSSCTLPFQPPTSHISRGPWGELLGTAPGYMAVLVARILELDNETVPRIFSGRPHLTFTIGEAARSCASALIIYTTSHV